MRLLLLLHMVWAHSDEEEEADKRCIQKLIFLIYNKSSFCAFGPDLPDDAYQEWYFLNQSIPANTNCNGQFLSPVTKNIELVLMTSDALSQCRLGYKFTLRKLLSIVESGPEILIDCCGAVVGSDENCANGTQIYTKISFSEPVNIFF